MSGTHSEPTFTLPKVPVPHKDFISFVRDKSWKDITGAVAPYNDYEAKLREGFAQFRDHEALSDPNINAVPVFGSENDALRVRSRNCDDNSLSEKFIMPLDTTSRKKDGAAATVESIQEFKKNFNLFSESSLVDLDWSNIVAAGSSVVTPLLPVPKKHGASKKAQREYYHEQLAPSSDVDLFIWGLDEAAALEKIKQIEANVRNAILDEVTTVRTKNAITIASRYPVRHVQIVLRLYKSVSEILSGFDVDCSCFAYDGRQVYGTPRGITAFMTQINTIDLSRRSPSYESRLSKYAHRGFEVYCPDLDRSRIDPTIFERSFARTMGLARLLVLEQLPKPNDREEYLNQRREERGRPTIDHGYWGRSGLPNNIKDRDPDDVAEWVYDDQVASYHSFSVPYGPKYHAKKIEKLLFTKDILLNAEWNHKKDRNVNLHRHPCFMGPIDSVVHDCCGSCPQPRTDEEVEVAKEECQIYISGDLTFMTDDPGRQTIGSFNPLTKDDWTDMAYVGNTQELCQKICDGDLEFVQTWCGNNHEFLDRRDHTGRTPLHVATQSSTPEIVRSLVKSGARIVARLVDGTTALHIAALRGNAEIVTILLEQSEENEELEGEKEERKRASKRDHVSPDVDTDADDGETSKDESDGTDEEFDDGSEDDDSDQDMATTEGSFVNIGKKKPVENDALDGADDSEPDVYDLNVLAWDAPVSPLHLAILGGHAEVAKVLISTFEADVLLPIKLINQYSRRPQDAIMTLMLAAQLTGPPALDVTKTLISHGASSAQADMNHISAFHYLTAKNKIQLLKACFEDDGVAARSALDHLVVQSNYWQITVDTPLITAINTGNQNLVNAFLDFGAKPIVDLDDFAKAYTTEKEANAYRYWRKQDDNLTKIWKEYTKQPVLLAAENEMPDIVIRMVKLGADINTVDSIGHTAVGTFAEDSKTRLRGSSLLDVVNRKALEIDRAVESRFKLPEPVTIEDDQAYLEGLSPDSYERWYISKTVEGARNIVAEWKEEREKRLKEDKNQAGQRERLANLQSLKERFNSLKSLLLERGAKTLDEMHPDMARDPSEYQDNQEDPKKGRAFEPKVDFRVSCTDSVRDGYLQLFEAAWEGNLAKIKELTLAKWGTDQKQSPLSVATQDAKGFTPIFIAAYRRQFDVMRMLLEIADTQYKPPSKSSELRQYRIAEEDSDCDSQDSEDELAISSRIVDETYTVDNTAGLQRSVGSKHSASDVLNMRAEMWTLLDQPEKEACKALDCKMNTLCLRDGRTPWETFREALSQRCYITFTFSRYALFERDRLLLRSWLRCGQDTANMKGNKVTQEYLGFDRSDFAFALDHGFIEEASEMIKICGSELPLKAFLKESGIDENERPKYYQGLRIGGKQMKGWAREHHGNAPHEPLSRQTSPLLNAANQGSLVGVEWFLSDTPSRLYKEYGAANAKKPRLQALAKANGGFDQAVGTWLKQRSDLALHGAVLSKAVASKSLEVIKYLVNIFPASVNLPASKSGLTPLALAFLTGRPDAAKALIEAGAEQTTRDKQGKNLVHLALRYIHQRNPPSIKKLKSLLSLIDPRLLPSLFIERCRDEPTALSPLAYWLSESRGKNFRYFINHDTLPLDPKILTLLYSFGGAAALEMMDGSGQFLIHHVVKHSHVGMVKNMLERDPALLMRENAMGQTAMELAESLYIRDCIKGNPDISACKYKSVMKRDVKDFALAKTNSSQNAKNDAHDHDDDDDGDDYTLSTPTNSSAASSETEPTLDSESDSDSDSDSDSYSRDKSKAPSSSIRRVYQICRATLTSTSPSTLTATSTSPTHPPPHKRKLVSVIQAREVAKRLAERTNEKRKANEELYRRALMEGDAGYDEEEEVERREKRRKREEEGGGGEGTDEVDRWLEGVGVYL